MGFEVADVHGLKCATATSIASVTPEEMADAFRSVAGEDVDLLIQAGTNLPGAKFAAQLEQELGKPVLSINAITTWHAYRANGITDRIEGFGSLLLEH